MKRIVAAFLFLATTAVAAPPRTPGPRLDLVDTQRRLDVNRLDLFVTNIGSIGFDLSTGNSGLYYPIGDGRTVLFASGLWAAGKIGGQNRLAIAEYSMEWRPGGAPGGVAENPSALDQIVYKTSSTDPAFENGSGPGTPPQDQVGHMSWAQYVSGAAPHGAPTRMIRVDDTSTPAAGDSIDLVGPDLPGDLATWCIYNDLDPMGHTNNAGFTPPMGLEVKQTIWGYTAPNTILDDVAFVRFQIRNASAARIDSAYFAFWADPDVGFPNDDVCGWDGANGIAYTYNATNNDLQYGSAPPAFGIALLESPIPVSPSHPFGASSFGRYVNGTDPNSTQQTVWAMHGFQFNGQPWIDPNTLSSTAFPFNGDPTDGSGWLDTNASDRRMLLSVGPLTLAPGAATTLRYAIVVGQGNDRLASIARMRCIVARLRAAETSEPTRPFPASFSASCDGTVPALATLVDASATLDAVTLLWYVAGGASESYALERRVDESEWRSLATVSADGDDFVRYVDHDVVPGARNTYRLVGGGMPQGEVTVAVPAASEIPALAVGAHFAAGGAPTLELALPSDGEVRYDVYSLGGRRLLGGSLGVLAAGHRTAPIASAGSLAPGVYLVRVRQGTAEARGKALVLRP